MACRRSASSQITVRYRLGNLAALLLEAAMAAVTDEEAQRDSPKLWPLIKNRREHAKIANGLGHCYVLNKVQAVHVDEPGIESGIEEDVGRFEVAMHEAAVVQACNDDSEAFSQRARVHAGLADGGGQSPSSRHFIGDDVCGHRPA